MSAAKPVLPHGDNRLEHVLTVGAAMRTEQRVARLTSALSLSDEDEEEGGFVTFAAAQAGSTPSWPSPLPVPDPKLVGPDCVANTFFAIRGAEEQEFQAISSMNRLQASEMESTPDDIVDASEMMVYLVNSLIAAHVSVLTRGRSCAEQVFAGVLARCSVAEAQFPDVFAGVTVSTEAKLSMFFKIDVEPSYFQKAPAFHGISMPPLGDTAPIYDRLRLVVTEYAMLASEYARAKKRTIPRKFKHDGQAVLRSIAKRNASVAMSDMGRFSFEHEYNKLLIDLYDLIDLNVGKMPRPVLEAKADSIRQAASGKSRVMGGNSGNMMKELAGAIERLLQEAIM